jgi:hypothetical protein
VISKAYIFWGGENKQAAKPRGTRVGDGSVCWGWPAANPENAAWARSVSRRHGSPLQFDTPGSIYLVHPLLQSMQCQQHYVLHYWIMNLALLGWYCILDDIKTVADCSTPSGSVITHIATRRITLRQYGPFSLKRVGQVESVYAVCQIRKTCWATRLRLSVTFSPLKRLGWIMWSESWMFITT